MTRKDQGFTLIELMIVVAIIAIIAAIAVPNLLSARLAANESNAISTLRNLVSAQAQFQSISAIDEDADGSGAYGGFGELSGRVPLNSRDNANAGLSPAPIDPPILASTFQNVDAAGMVNKSGYLFQVHLPDNALAPQPETADGVPNAAWDEDQCEVFWSAYAWPVDTGTTGNRCFFVNQRGEIIQSKMTILPYSGAADAPAGAAALSAGEMDSPLGINGVAATDGNTWTVVQ